MLKHFCLMENLFQIFCFSSYIPSFIIIIKKLFFQCKINFKLPSHLAQYYKNKRKYLCEHIYKCTKGEGGIEQSSQIEQQQQGGGWLWDQFC